MIRSDAPGSSARCGSGKLPSMDRFVAGLAAALVASVLTTSSASARRNGIAADSCNGCHGGGKAPDVRLLAAPMNPSLGQTIAITLEIAAVNGQVGGFFVELDGAGLLQNVANSGVQSFNALSLGHSAPKTASGGVVRFVFNWTAPSTAPGGVVLRASALSANGDDTSQGDGFGHAQLLLAYGCTGQLYTADVDGDGFGASEYGQKLDCSMPQGYAARAGDCLEYNADVHPDAAERCNDMDDDCDGKLDEGLPIAPQYRDNDGDGYGSGAESIMDCSSPKGYAATSRDCDDRVASTHPQANESCNFVDDDCDGRTDEGVRPSCGVGWCRRLADSCTQPLCTPGQPRAEECNEFDDDCDDRLDEEVTCPSRGRCVEGQCLPPTAAAMSVDAGFQPALEAEAGAGGDSRPSASAACAGAQAKQPGCAKAEPLPASQSGDTGCNLTHTGGRSGAGWLALVCALAVALERSVARRTRARKFRGGCA